MIYTAIIGGKDAIRSDIKCFTESHCLGNHRMDAKVYKILPHLFINDEWTIWIDGNIRLFVSEQELIDMTKPKHVGVFIHPDRDCIYEEGYFCEKVGKDKPEIIHKQLQDYKSMGYPKNNGLGACFIIVRKNTDKVNQLNEVWWSHIKKHSVRDQLSFPVVFGDNVKYLPKVPMRKNKYFERLKHTI